MNRTPLIIFTIKSTSVKRAATLGEGSPLVLSAMIEANSGLSQQGRLDMSPLKFEHSAASARPAASQMDQSHTPSPEHWKKGHVNRWQDCHTYLSPSKKKHNVVVDCGLDMGWWLEFLYIHWNGEMVSQPRVSITNARTQHSNPSKIKNQGSKSIRNKNKQGSKHRTYLQESFFPPHCVGFFFFCFNFFDFSQLLEPKLETSAAYVRVAASCHLHHRFDLQQHLFGSPSVVIRGVNTYVAMFSFTGQLVDMN